MPVRFASLAVQGLVMGIASAAMAQVNLPSNPTIHSIKPSTTGVPGAEVRVMTVDPEGNLWIASRWPFWSECGLAMLSPTEQEFTPLPGGGFDTGLWRVWSNVQHPIPSPYIDDIEFTTDGLMWIGSEGGLTRFDRTASNQESMWATWNAGNSPLMVHGVESVDSQADGTLWLVNREVNGPLGVLFEFDPAANEWEQHPLSGGVQSLFVGLDDKVYVTHELKSGFSVYDGVTWTHQPANEGLGGGLQDFEGNLWFVAWDGVVKWDGQSFQKWTGLGGTQTVTGVSLGLDGTVYVSTWYGPIYRMIDGEIPSFFVDAQGLPRSVIERPNGDFFINNYGSTLALGRVRQYSADGSLLRRMNTYNSGLPDYFIGNIQSDRSGNLWFACGEGGLTRMLGGDGSPEAPTRWRNWGDHNDGSEPNPWAGNEPMYSMYEDDQGLIWMGGNGIGLWDPDLGEFLGFWNWQNSSLGVDSFIRILQDGNGDIWAFSDYTGGYRLNPDTNDWEQQLFGAAWTTANYVNDATRDIDGNLWVTTDVGLHLFDGETWFAINSFHGSPVEWPTTVKADPSGGIWIGASNGLVHYQAGEWEIYDSSNSPMPTDHVHGLTVRQDGLVAMSVADFNKPVPWPNGVVLFDGAQWQVYSYETHGLPHYQLGDVEFDVDGDVWVSTISEGVVEIVIHDDGAQPLAGDVNGDGVVDGADLGMLLGAWGTEGPVGSGAKLSPDLNGDGVVDGADLGLMLGYWM